MPTPTATSPESIALPSGVQTGPPAMSLGDALATAGDPDFASVLYALVALGACDAIRALGASRARTIAAPVLAEAKARMGLLPGAAA